MDKSLMQTITAIALVVIIGVLGFLWIKTRQTQIKQDAIIRCGQIAAESGTKEAPFNGGLYQICLEDNGYTTVLK